MFSLNPGQAHMFEFLEVVRECGAWNSKFRLDISYDHPAGVGGQENPHDPEPRLRSHSEKHLGISRNISIFGFHDFLAIDRHVR